MGTITLSLIIIFAIMLVGGFIVYLVASFCFPAKKEQKIVKIVEKTEKEKIEESIDALESRKENIVKQLIEQKEPEVEEVPEEKVEEVPVKEEEPVAEEESVVIEEPVITEEPVVEVVEENPTVTSVEIITVQVTPEEVVNDNEGKQFGIVDEMPEKKNPRRSRAFDIKLSSSPESVKKSFSEIINKFRSYGISPKFGKMKVTLKLEKDTIGRLFFKAKKLVLCLPLDPKSEKYNVEVYKQLDLNDKKGYEEFPFGIKISTKKSAKLAMGLIDEVAKNYNLTEKENFRVIDYVEKYPNIYSNFEQLGYGWMLKEEVVREEADIWPDSFAEKILLTQPLHEKMPKRVIREDVRIEEFNNRYTDTKERVDLVRLKESGIVPEEANYLVVKASARINKPFNVYAHEFEPDAVKMICMAGGQAYKLVFDPDTEDSDRI